jgi:tetratricopeptide (TPR) repeat protein
LLHDYPEAENYYQQSLSLNRSIGNRYGEAVSLNSLGGVYLELKDYPKTLAYCQQALEINRLTGHRRGAAHCLENLAAAYQGLHQPEAARRCSEEAQTIRQSFSDNPHLNNAEAEFSERV